MSETKKQFIRQIQAYYRDEYPAVMAADVIKLLPADREMLSALYQILIRRNPAKYKTVPDVAAFDESIRELYDAYPEYRQGVRYTHPVAQLEDGSGIPVEVGEEYVTDLLAAFRDDRLKTGVDPDDPRPTPEEFERKWLRERAFMEVVKGEK